MNSTKSIPPKLAEQFLSWFCKDELLEEILGDLQEYYDELTEQPNWKRNFYYWFHVFNFLRPFAIRNFKSENTNHYAIFRHNFIISFRSFNRYKTSFLINLIGLSTGLTCTLLIYLWVNDELNIDRFHEKDGRLFQVMQNLPTPNGIKTIEGTPGLLARTLADEMPEVEYATSVITSSFFDSDEGIISVKNTQLKARGQFVEQDYLNIFSWNLIQGDKNSVLKDKYAILISDELARELFYSQENIIGKAIEWNHDDFNGVYHVSGVFEKLPHNSTAQFDLLFNYELFLEKYDYIKKWGNSSPSTYMILKERTDVEKFNDKIRDFRRSKYKELVGMEYLESIGTLFLQHYSDRYLYNSYKNGIQAGGRIVYVRLFSIMALLLLTIASINFMNLSTAKATRRMKEIGVKKTVGSGQKAIIFQFLGESVLMTFLSLMMALLLVALLLPEFNGITGKYLTLNFSTNFVASILGITLVTGIFSGSYPALYLSRLRPANVLKGKFSPSTGTTRIRKGLVVFQFTISVMLIVSVLVVYKQLEFIQTKNLRLNKDNVLTFEKEGQLNENLETFLHEVKNMPEVINASSSWHNLIGDVGDLDIAWEGKKPDEHIAFGNIEVGYDWVETLGIEMVEGRAFSREFGSDSLKVIFNEAAISAMGLEDPIGKSIRVWGMKKQIIGITKNFHFKSLYEEIRPCLIQCYPNGGNVLVKIKAGMEQKAIDQIGNFYQEYNPGFPFDYKFMDAEYQELYVAEQRVSALSKYFAGIAILISCLGLFGLAAFTAERKLKEIGIRKILGSSVFGIVRLLSGDFTKMVGIAIGIALPVSYFIAKSWLDQFAYRIGLEWWFFIGAGLMALFIAWFTVGVQTVKAARINPTECLKDE